MYTHAQPVEESLTTSQTLKRGFDLAFSLVLFVIASPFIILVLFFLFVENALRGHPYTPLFYTETRISQGAPFILFKFNIFKYHYIEKLRAEGKLIHTKLLEKNGGVTFVGWVLKQIYMDELPQLFNVFKGDLSLVGPRPLNLEAYQLLKEETARQGFSPSLSIIKGGITGYFQSYKGKTKQSWNYFDQEYLKVFQERSAFHLLWFDITILLRTIKVILRAKGI